jgi:hypothetical protein
MACVRLGSYAVTMATEKTGPTGKLYLGAEIPVVGIHSPVASRADRFISNSVLIATLLDPEVKAVAECRMYVDLCQTLRRYNTVNLRRSHYSWTEI